MQDKVEQHLVSETDTSDDVSRSFATNPNRTALY